MSDQLAADRCNAEAANERIDQFNSEQSEKYNSARLHTVVGFSVAAVGTVVTVVGLLVRAHPVSFPKLQGMVTRRNDQSGLELTVEPAGLTLRW